MKKLLIAAMIIFTVSCQTKDTSFADDNKIDITSFNKLPIIEAILNGKKAYFILDSGGSVTVLDENQQEKYGFYAEESTDVEAAAGYGGVANFKSASDVNLEMGGVRFFTNYKAKDLSTIVNIIGSNEGVQIVGIIGADIMKKNKFILDFSNNTVSLGQ